MRQRRVRVFTSIKNFRLERWSELPRPNLKACVSVHVSSSVPDSLLIRMAAATRARVDAPSFLPYPSICRVRSPHHAAARLFFVWDEANPMPAVGCYSKTEACEFSDPHFEGESVQSLDIRFMSF